MFIQWLSSIFIETILTSDFTLRNKKGDKSFCNSAFLSKNKRQKSSYNKPFVSFTCLNNAHKSIFLWVINATWFTIRVTSQKKKESNQQNTHTLVAIIDFKIAKRPGAHQRCTTRTPPLHVSSSIFGSKSKAQKHKDKTCR